MYSMYLPLPSLPRFSATSLARTNCRVWLRSSKQLHRASGLPSTDRPSLQIRLLDFWARLPAMRPSRKVSGKRGIDGLLADAASGARLAPADAALLYERASLLDLGEAADQRRRALHPENRVTYIIDRNVNYTNVCVTACKFCNFFRPEKSRDGYTLSREELAQKFAETVALGGIQILLQGGVNPHLPLTYYEDLFRWTKANFPLALHALSPEEVSFIARQEGLSIATVLERLIAAGLDSLPGGGAEILDDDIRRRISPLKCSTDTWLEVMRQAHRLGLRTSATLVFGFRRKARTNGRASRTAAGFAGRDSRVHGVHLLALSGRGHAAAARRRYDGAALLTHLQPGASISRQLPQPAGVVANHGPDHRTGGIAFRRQRLRLGDDRGKRRIAGGRGIQVVRG
jgi:hypothetical protein